MTSPSVPIRPTAWRSAFALVFVLALAGCASVDPGPFRQFASAIQPLRAGTDAQAGTAVATSRQELIDKVAAGEVDPADLQLEFTDDGAGRFATSYGFAEREPNFAKLARFRQGLAALNDAMSGYAQALLELAGGGQGGDILPSTAEFEQMARDLNANAGSAARALGVSVDPGKQALLSAAAVELFRAYIEHKRRRALAAAIAEVQPRVVEFADAARQAVAFLASLVETDYDRKILPLAIVTPPDAGPILALNDTTQATLATLKSLSESYRRLPAAHRDLAAAASKKKTGLAGLVALGDEASRLHGLVTQLEAANVAAAAQGDSR